MQLSHFQSEPVFGQVQCLKAHHVSHYHYLLTIVLCGTFESENLPQEAAQQFQQIPPHTWPRPLR